MSAQHADFDFMNCGSIAILTPLSEAANDWASDNWPDDAMQYAGGLVIEPRYAGDILAGIRADGLTVQVPNPMHR